MATKGNIRSMRFSDEIIGIIEAQPGESFTAKFENLVRKCVIELPKKEQELARIQKLIADEHENLRTVTRAKEKFTQNVNQLNWALESMTNQVNRCTKALEEIKE